MRCLTNFAAFGNCICKLFRLAVKTGKFLRYSFTETVVELKMRLAFTLSENSFIRRSEHLTVTYRNE